MYYENTLRVSLAVVAEWWRVSAIDGKEPPRAAFAGRLVCACSGINAPGRLFVSLTSMFASLAGMAG